MNVSARLSVGKWSIDSAADPHTELNAISVSSSPAAPNRATIRLYVAPGKPSGLLDQAIAAATGAATGALAGAAGLGGGEPSFTVSVRGNDISDGDAVGVSLSAGETSATVFSGEVLSAASDLGLTTIVAAGGARRLATARLNQVFENQSADRVVTALAKQAGAATGRIGLSAVYPYLVIDETRSLFDQIRTLARREDMTCYFNSDDELTVEGFSKTAADHELYYGIDVLDLQIFNTVPASDHTRVYVGSPASARGQNAWHWLSKNAAASQSAVGGGVKLLAISDGAVRSKDAADRLAVGKYGAIKDGATRGRVKLLGNPAIKLNDAININDAPKAELDGLYKVSAVEHRFSKAQGYLTLVEFSGQGGAQAAGGLLGALGDLAGAVGF